MFAPLAAIVVDEPAHIVVTPPVAVTVGTGFTDMVVVAVLLQPAALVPVTVYVRVAVVLQTTEAPVVALRPVDGVQTYVLPPPALIVVELPIQIAEDTGVAVMVGIAFTVIVAVARLAQPVAVLVPVTEYVVVTVRLNVTVAPVVALRPVAGVHE